MSKKSFKKKKAHQAACRKQALACRVNRADGTYISASSTLRTDVEQQDGYRVGRR